MRRPKTIKSFNSFANALAEQAPDSVAVQADRRLAKRGPWGSGYYSGPVGVIGEFDHGLVYTVSEAARQQRFRESLFTAFQSTRGIGDALERNKRAVSVLLAAEIRVGQLSLILSDVEVYLAEPDYVPVSDAKLRELHFQAQYYEISAPEFKV